MSAWSTLHLPADAARVLRNAPEVHFAQTAEELVELAVRDAGPDGVHRVSYTLPDGREIVEAEVGRVRNGIAANYLEPYMRRRDPDCMVIGDEGPTNKPTYHQRFGEPFDDLRAQTFEWLETQPLAVFAFTAGVGSDGTPAIAIAPANAGFFALGLALLQGICSLDELERNGKAQPGAVLYVAPPFRHTRFEGRQVVVHNRTPDLHELFAYNLYPGPSAKKGIYGVLLNLGEKRGWTTAHCSTVRVTTPYDNEVVFMHEGASGGGKSEMLEHIHRQDDGRLLLGENTVDGEHRLVTLPRTCDLSPVTDDMALCPPEMQATDGPRKLTLADAENAWFVRVNHIDRYGVDPHLERLCTQPERPLLFLNIDAVPGSTALIWEHIQDEPGTPCPNPRVVIPRDIVPNISHGPVTVDVRSFGVRTPPCTAESPSYGILGLFHVLPPALAWLWRLVAPRGHANPSIVDTGGLSSEGVGSYWPFATGRRVEQANILLRQILSTPDTLFTLVPNQHVGAWRTSFAPQWIMREYLARRGSNPFRPDALIPARCPLLGYAMRAVSVEGVAIPTWFLRPETQPQVGEKAYDAGAEQLRGFFAEQLNKFLRDDDLHPYGRRIIERCLEGADIDAFERLSEVTPEELCAEEAYAPQA
jgi:hypothetical protein